MADDFAADNLNYRHGNGSVEIATSPRRYEGVMVPRASGEIIPLKRHEAARLSLIEAKNRLRVKPGGIREKVDFIAVCISQKWKCCLCGELMTPRLKGDEPNAVSVEHNPALSVSNEHSARTVFAAHRRCNIAKGHKSDIPRAAKIKRVIKDEDRHKLRMENKAKLSREVFKRERRAEAKIQSRPFSPPLLKTVRSEHPGGAVNGWGKKKGSWPKQKFPSRSARSKPAT